MLCRWFNFSDLTHEEFYESYIEYNYVKRLLIIIVSNLTHQKYVGRLQC